LKKLFFWKNFFVDLKLFVNIFVLFKKYLQRVKSFKKLFINILYLYIIYLLFG